MRKRQVPIFLRHDRSPNAQRKRRVRCEGKFLPRADASVFGPECDRPDMDRRRKEMSRRRTATKSEIRKKIRKENMDKKNGNAKNCKCHFLRTRFVHPMHEPAQFVHPMRGGKRCPLLRQISTSRCLIARNIAFR